MLESAYQAKLIKTLERIFPGCLIVKQDANQRQGIPDLLILHGRRWAMLEVKRERPGRLSRYEANQEWYLNHYNEMSFATCIYPENEEEVLDALQHALSP